MFLREGVLSEMNLKELIKGQKLRIDNHRRGTRSIDYYDDPSNDIHLDKTVYDGRKAKEIYQIRVPLNSDRPVTINGDESILMPNRIMREIREAFQDEGIRKNFINEVRDVLKNYPLKNKDKYKGADEEEILQKKVYAAMSRIARCFDLKWDEGQIKKYIRETKKHGKRYIGLAEEKDNTYYLAFEQSNITVGDYTKILKNKSTFN